MINGLDQHITGEESSSIQWVEGNTFSHKFYIFKGISNVFSRVNLI